MWVWRSLCVCGRRLAQQAAWQRVGAHRAWTLILWLFLSLGIIMGSQWAYMELGWGGYWAWDRWRMPASCPAHGHRIPAQHHHPGTAWHPQGLNVVLIWLTYFLVILGTFTARSGVLESVQFRPQRCRPVLPGLPDHYRLRFQRLPVRPAASPARRAPDRSYSSREAAFLAQLALYRHCFCDAGVHSSPCSADLTGQRISVAAPLQQGQWPALPYAAVARGRRSPVGWRHTSRQPSQFTIPTIIALITAALVFVFARSLYPMIGLAICALRNGHHRPGVCAAP